MPAPGWLRALLILLSLAGVVAADYLMGLVKWLNTVQARRQEAATRSKKFGAKLWSPSETHKERIPPMTVELAMLIASCVLCLIQIVIASHASSLQRGYRWTASARDTEVPPLTGLAGRLERALRNFLETFPVFVAAALLVHLLGREGPLSEWGAILYFVARLAYVPLYVAGIPIIRSLVWNVAFVGIVLLLVAAAWG